MEFLISMIAIGVAIYSLQRVSSLERDVRALKECKEESILGGSTAVIGQVSYGSHIPVDPQTLPPAPAPAPLPKQVTPSLVDTFFAWLKEDWLVKIGGFIMLLGFGWLVSYAFAEGWIDEQGRIALGFLLGVCLILGGYFRMAKYVQQGGVFLVTGSATVLLTVFAARANYQLLNAEIAIILVFLTSAFVALTALRYKTQSLALSSIVLAGLAPVLSNAHASGGMGLMSYLLLLVLGTLSIVWFTGWREMIVLSMVVVFLYAIPYISGMVNADDRLSVFAFIFTSVFFLAMAISIVRRGPSPRRILDVLAIALNGVMLTLWVLGLVDKEWQSLVLVFFALVFASGAYIMSLLSGRRDPFYLHLGVSVVLLSTALVTELEGAILTVALTIETVVLVCMTYIGTKSFEGAVRATVLLVIPGIIVLGHLASYGDQTLVLEENFAAVVVFLASLFVLAYFFRVLKLRHEDDSHVSRSNIVTVLEVVGYVGVLMLGWSFLHNLVSEGLATFLSLLIYTVIGIALYASGQQSSKARERKAGTALLVVVILRLLLIDVWDLSDTARIPVFFVVGALLMATAFLKRNTQTRLHD